MARCNSCEYTTSHRLRHDLSQLSHGVNIAAPLDDLIGNPMALLGRYSALTVVKKVDLLIRGETKLGYIRLTGQAEG